MKLLYLAGPYSENPEENIKKAGEYAKELTRQGYNVFSPHYNYQYAKEFGYKNIIERCIEILEKCDVIAMIPEWRKSTGASFEHLIAKLFKIKIIYLT